MGSAGAQSLAESGRPLEQTVPAGDERRENLVQNLLAAHQDGANGLLETAEVFRETLQPVVAHGRILWI